MAQRKKKLLRRKKRDHELQSDDEEFEVATRVKDDQDTVSLSAPNQVDLDYRVVSTGFDGNCTGPCGAGNWSPYIGVHPNRMCPKHTTENQFQWFKADGICISVVVIAPPPHSRDPRTV